MELPSCVLHNKMHAGPRSALADRPALQNRDAALSVLHALLKDALPAQQGGQSVTF